MYNARRRGIPQKLWESALFEKRPVMDLLSETRTVATGPQWRIREACEMHSFWIVHVACVCDRAVATVSGQELYPSIDVLLLCCRDGELRIAKFSHDRNFEEGSLRAGDGS